MAPSNANDVTSAAMAAAAASQDEVDYAEAGRQLLATVNLQDEGLGTPQR